MRNKIAILAVLITVYFGLKYYIPYGDYIIYPITLLVTFLHEFGHSFFAIITGGRVEGIEINNDGSGFAMISGGIWPILSMGGYIGSAIFGNILLYIGLKKKKYAEIVIYFLAGLMIFTAIFWFNSIFSSIILFLISGFFILLASKTNIDSYILSFLGVTSIIYIIEDFNGGPSSDLSKFADYFVIVPQVVWMYIWLIIVIIITGLNLKFIFKK